MSFNSKLMQKLNIMAVNKQIDTASMREVQRHYRKLFDRVKKTKKPLFLSSRNKTEVVILSIDLYNKMFQLFKKQKKEDESISWKDIEKNMKKISQKGKKTDLTKFIINDRENH